MNIEFVKGGFFIPPFGNVWAGRQLNLENTQAERFIKLGYAKAVLVENKPEKTVKRTKKR